MYLQRVFLPSRVLANIHSILAYHVPMYIGCRPTHQIPVQCWASVAVFAQPRGILPMLFQCCPTVFDAGQKLKQHWVIAPCFLTAALLCG